MIENFFLSDFIGVKVFLLVFIFKVIGHLCHLSSIFKSTSHSLVFSNNKKPPKCLKMGED